MKSRAIIVAATGEMSGIKAITLPRIKAYAEQVGAELVIFEDMPEKYQHPKYRMFGAAEIDAERILILDADILIRDGAPDIFAELPAGNHILDEGAIRSDGVFNGHKYEVCNYAHEWVDFGAHWWSPGVVLMDGEAIKQVYQMPPWDVMENLFTVAGGQRIVKNMPWINFQIARNGIEITPLDWKWNCFVNGRERVRKAYFWHCAGDESKYNPNTKVKIAQGALKMYGELTKPMHVHCVMGKNQKAWILGRMWEAIKQHAPAGSICTEGDTASNERGVINYYNPYRGYRGKTKGIDIVFCTHPEIEPLFWESAQEADHVVTMCDKYKNELIERGVSPERVTRIYPGVDDEFKDDRLRIFNPSIISGRPRKGKELWDRLAQEDWINARCSDGRVTKEQLMLEYHAADVIVSTATMEGGPMALPEALNIGKPCVMPAGVGLVDEIDCPLIMRYEAENYDDLLCALQIHYERKQQQPRYLLGWTWERWATEHWKVFREMASSVRIEEDTEESSEQTAGSKARKRRTQGVVRKA